jgi:hypothetical protein
MVHEIGHAWMNYATDTMLSRGVAHWPASDLASGRMGLNAEGSGFNWQIIPIGDGNYRLQTPAWPPTIKSLEFRPLELYIMGLLPADSVTPALILPSTVNPYTITEGMITTATSYSIDSYIAAHGTRVPAFSASPKEFALATVVLSYGRLLSSVEMAYFDFLAAQTESEVELPSSVLGFASGVSWPFWIITGGRARLRSRID